MIINRIYRTAAQSLRSFANKSEMDEHIKAHVFAAGRKLHKNARTVLDILAKHAVCVTGVSWRNETKLAKEIGVHRTTVNRAIDRLEELGIGRRVSVNLNGMELHYFVFQRFNVQAFCTENATDLHTEESAENVSAPKDSADFSGNESIESTEAKETNKEDDDLDTVFHRIADEEKLPAVERQTVLERIKKYVAGVGNIVAYVKSAIKRALVGCRKPYNARRNNSTGKVTSQSHRNADNASSFQQAITADIETKKQRATKAGKSDVLPDWAIKQRQEQQERDRLAAERASRMTEEEYAEKRARVAELLRQMGER